MTDEEKREIRMRLREHWLKLGQPKKIDFVDDLGRVIDHLANFYNMAPNLLNASDDKFERFFEKLYRLDKRALLFYVVSRRDKLTDGQWKFAKKFFEERNKEIDWGAVEEITTQTFGNKKRRKTYILKKNGKRFGLDEWVDEYVRDLNCLYKGKTVYNDPDMKGHNQFYEDLTKFLNVREKSVRLKEEWHYEFVGGNEIEVKNEKGEKLFVIFSDQFGFSAPNMGKGHPYDVYAEVSDYNADVLKEIAGYVYYSRTLGGSFLWPVNGGKGYNSFGRGGTRFYNADKPDDHYIEDRADLTLLEIKKYYDGVDMSKGILSGYLTDDMRKWLDHFGDFPTYVKFFCLDGFVDENDMPRPLLGTLEGLEDVLDGTSWKRIMKGRGREIEEKNEDYRKELKMMFEKLQGMILERTDVMEEVIKGE